MRCLAKVAVIIPSFNRKHTLNRALQSVLSQTHQPDEIILVDDGSTDNTAEFIAENYPSITVLSQSQQGVSAARNKGIQHAQADWLAFLDSDDAWHADKLSMQLRALQEYPSNFICHTNEVWYHNGKLRNQKDKHQKMGGEIFQACLPLCRISPSSVIIHKNVFNDVGLFDVNLPACEDYDLWLRITAQYPVLFIDHALTFKYGGHDDQLSKLYKGMDKFRIQALLKIIHSGILKQDDLNSANTILKEKILIYLSGCKKRQKLDEVHTYEQLLQQL